MRNPASIGLPDKFAEWRKGQDRALKDILYSTDRFVMLTTPTGSGKSATYMGATALEDDRRACVLTATKALQDQLLGDFQRIGLVDMRGRQNYPCEEDERVTAADGVCTAGVYCPFIKYPGCAYYDQARLAAASRLVVTNYAYWFHDEESRRIGEFETLVLDEAHTAPDQLSDYAAVEVTEKQLAELGLPAPGGRRSAVAWASACVEALAILLDSDPAFETKKAAKRLQRDLVRMCRLSEQQWVEDRQGKGPGMRKWRWDLVDPAALAEELLFRGATRVVLASASVRKKTLELLGVDQNVKVIEQDSTFPVKRRPVYYWPVASVRREMREDEKQGWVDAMDQIVGARADRKGIVHSVSYDRAWEIFNRSRLRSSGVFLVDSRKRKTSELVDEFRDRRPPCVLISPAVGTGLDFPYDELEFQIIGKVPFPDLQSPLVRARQERDKSYGAYVAMQQIVQQTGRGMRAADDQCETFIMDSNFGWLRGAYWDFAPQWWHRAVRSVGKGRGAPDPLPKL